jgi:lipopolysaccharide/colanic/teichoic acid biosynthesis glycosyltransferase
MIAIDRSVPANSRYPEWMKRAVDLLLCVPFMLLAIPFALLAAIAVKATSPGPALFRQQRVGRNGRLFRLYKFRTMRLGDSGPNVTAQGDARITPVGQILRKSKLDELPQFINVLRGDMSLVGPRPEVPEYVAHYSPEQRRVLAVRPGITGISQLEFRNEEAMLADREDVPSFYIQEIMPRKLELDLRYVLEHTLWMDLGILVRTVVAVLLR